MHRNFTPETEIVFIAQRGLHSIDDTSDEIKLKGKIVVARKSVTDQDPAYGIEVTELVKENNIGAGLERPTIGQKMAVAPDQILDHTTGGVFHETPKVGGSVWWANYYNSNQHTSV
jgi:hypothetical protein